MQRFGSFGSSVKRKLLQMSEMSVTWPSVKCEAVALQLGAKPSICQDSLVLELKE